MYERKEFPKPTDPELIERIKAMYLSGMTMLEISYELGLKKSQISHILKKNNIAKQAVDSKCVTCIYGTSKGYCMYILATGHSRPCPPDGECTERVEGERIKMGDSLDDPILPRKIKISECYSQAHFD